MIVDVAPDLLAFLQQEETRGRNTELELRAETALKSYNGDYYGDEVDGCSKVVSRDVAETIDYMTVSVLRTFISGDDIVDFEPDSSANVQNADDATVVLHRDLQKNGYKLLHDWLKEGNINTLGIVKSCVEQTHKRTEFHTFDPEGDGAIQADHIATDDESGLSLYKGVKLQPAPPEFRDYLVPLEEFRISPEARDPDDAVYIAHATNVSLSELVEMGFEYDDLESVQGDVVPDVLTQARDAGLALQPNNYTGANRRVVLMEEYVRYDADRDGIAERLCVHRVGNTVLRIEPCDYQPFVIYCPFPMPGRLAGHSLADKVADIQRINTALMRLYLDGQYHTLAPRLWVPDECVTETTYDDLLTVVSGQLVRGKGPNRPEPLNEAFNGDSALKAIEFMIGQRESRTGITRLNQGMDADTLNKTATGTALMQAQGQQMEEYLARNFAEAVSKLMLLKLKLYSRYGSPMELRVDGEFREIDPRQWPEDMGAMIRVGLGSGRKDQRVQNRMTFLQVMRECMIGGVPIVQPEQLYKMMVGLARDMNLGSPSDYVIDPQTLPPQQGPAPDPDMAKVQGELQINAQKLQLQSQKDAAHLQLQQQEMEGKLMTQHQVETGKLALQEQNQNMQAHIAVQGQQMDQNLQLRKMDLEEHVAKQDLARKDAESSAKVRQYRAGGQLDK